MVVVDASALIAFLLREEGWLEISKYMVETTSVDHIVKEFYNAVWRAVNVRRVINVTDAERIIALFKTYLEKNMIIEPETKYIEGAFKIALEHNITVYDAIYIEQALKCNKPLLTLDQKQREVAEKLGVETLP